MLFLDKIAEFQGKDGQAWESPRLALVGLDRAGVGAGLTFDCEEHGLADVGAHTIAGLAEVVADVFFQDMAYQQGAVGQDLDAASKGHWVILLGVPTPWKEATVRGCGWNGLGVT